MTKYPIMHEIRLSSGHSVMVQVSDSEFLQFARIKR